MDNMGNILNKLLGKIFLKKPVFFGLDEQKITLLISPSMKIFGIYSSPERLSKKFPFEDRTYLNVNELKSWAEENDFDISFSAETPRLKRVLSTIFGDVLIENVKKEKELNIIVMEELDRSHLPESIKEWAKNNPQKFIENLQHVQNLLKK
jgi:hypothetical protein